MSRPPEPLPDALVGSAIRIGGGSVLTPGRARASDLWMPTRGVRLPAHTVDLHCVCCAHALTLPKVAVFSHTTVCRLIGLPVPQALENAALHVTVPSGTRAPRRAGLVGHQAELSQSEMCRWRGLSVPSPERTFVDLASMLSVDALVAVGDRLIHRRASFTTREELEDAVRSRCGVRGFRRGVEALALLDDGAESPKETETRLLLIRHGFADLSTNLEIFGDNHQFIARVDLAIASLKIAIEYEGDHHRERAQWQRDIARRRRIEAAGWLYLPVTQRDLTDPRELLVALIAAIASRTR